MWRSSIGRRPAEILALLTSIEFDGQRSPHQHDREVPAPPANSRRIYAYDLNKFSRADDVIAALSRLNADRQVRAFSLRATANFDPPQTRSRVRAKMHRRRGQPAGDHEKPRENPLNQIR